MPTYHGSGLGMMQSSRWYCAVQRHDISDPVLSFFKHFLELLLSLTKFSQNYRTYNSNVPQIGVTIFWQFPGLTGTRKGTVLKTGAQSKGSIRGSCSLAISIPVHRQVGHMTCIHRRILLFPACAFQHFNLSFVWTAIEAWIPHCSIIRGFKPRHAWSQTSTTVSRQCWYTFPAPEQFGHLWVVGIRRGPSVAASVITGSTLKHTPLAEHLAQAKYPANRSHNNAWAPVLVT